MEALSDNRGFFVLSVSAGLFQLWFRALFQNEQNSLKSTSILQ